MGYWDGDRDRAFEVARLLADLLPARSSIARFVFIYRHDAQKPDQETLNYLAAKFKYVDTRRCPVVGFGHPGGCNAIALSLFKIFRTDKQFAGTEAFLILESDCVMVRPAWDVELWDEWLRGKAHGKIVVGHAYPGCYQNPHGNHINASAMYARNIAEVLPSIEKVRMDVGHDWMNGPAIYPVSMDSPLFFLDYRKPTITREELFAPRKSGLVPLVHHGVRDDSAIRLVREEYKLLANQLSPTPQPA